MKVLACAPSNIALIKYMGKKENPGREASRRNLPENPSISLTLNTLCTWTEARRTNTSGVHWVPESPVAKGPVQVPRLDPAAVDRLGGHVSRLLEQLPELLERFGMSRSSESGGIEIRSGNTFPHSSGIASSASSFAALTLSVSTLAARDPRVFRQRFESDPRFRRALARLSRAGSGSSCRSFEGPWVEWGGEDAAALPTAMPKMAHFALLISKNPKTVPSTEAHARVKSSPLWKERAERVTERLQKMRAALASGNIGRVSHLAWTEAWEMHSLFHTSAEPFSYWEPGTIETLHWLASFMGGMNEDSPPIVTLDAGPNIHLIVEETQRGLWKSRLEERFGALFLGDMVLADGEGTGATIVDRPVDFSDRRVDSKEAF